MVSKTEEQAAARRAEELARLRERLQLLNRQRRTSRGVYSKAVLQEEIQFVCAEIVRIEGSANADAGDASARTPSPERDTPRSAVALLLTLANELVAYQAPLFDADPGQELAVTGSAAVEWLYEFRLRVREAIHRAQVAGWMAADSLPERIFVVHAEHWQESGMLASAHRTLKGATDRAVKYTNVLLSDEEFAEADATAQDWEERVASLQAAHDGDDEVVYVEIETLHVVD